MQDPWPDPERIHNSLPRFQVQEKEVLTVSLKRENEIASPRLT